MSLAAGARIGAYQIVGLIGSGGMGEVYRARDTKLQRDVAIKVLPEALAHDTERLARFQREAEVLASLNHPNIAAIYGLEDADGVKALVMELVEGPTLADRVAHGPIPVDEALSIAKQIAEAVEAAHDQGIIHRDLKPANIKLRSDGTVKVLDFGLAKAMEPSGAMSSNPTQSPTITTPAMTQAGMILGTAAYMSPEQAKGRPVDKRSDVWAFGAVLYEMLTGRQAFAGEGVVETLGAVIHKNLDWPALPADTPPAIRRMLQRCLQKDRRQRIPDMAMTRIEIEDAIREGPVTFAEPLRTKRRSHERLAWFAASLLVLFAAFGAALWLQSPPAESLTYRASILPLVEAPMVGVPPSRFTLSPDGQYLVFTSGQPGSPTTLWLRSLNRGSARQVAGTEGGEGPFWSPDSRFIGFFAQGKLKTIDITGGPPVPLADAQSGATAGSWSKDDVIVFPRAKSGLYRIHARRGGPVTAVTTLDEAAGDSRHWWPIFLPDGKHFLYEAIGSPLSIDDPRAVYIGSLDPNEKPRLLLTGGSNAKYAQGYVLFMRESTLMAQRFDTRRLALTGEPLLVAEGVDIGGSTGQSGAFSVSATGTLVYETAPPDSSSQLVWRDRSGKLVSALPERAAHGDSLELSPDGTRATVNVSASIRGPGDIWIVDLVRGVRWPFTRGDRNETRAIWSHDGKRIIFSGSGRTATTDLYMKSSNGAESEQLIPSDSFTKVPLSWSHDGQFLLYVTGGGGVTNANLWVLPLSGDRKPIPYMQTTYNENGARFSPNDRWVAFGSNESGLPQIYVAPFPATGEKDLVSAEATMNPAVGARWRADGRELFYVSRNRMLMATDIDGQGPKIKIGSARQLFPITGSGPIAYDVAADGSRFLFKAESERPSASPAALTLVTNWTAAVAKP